MDPLFFYTSKIIWLMVSPDTGLVFLLTAALVLLWCGAVKTARMLFTITVGLILIITVLPVGDWLLHPLETRFPSSPVLPEKVDGIIMLAGAEDLDNSRLWEQGEVYEDVERYLAFIRLIREYPEARKVFSGGSGDMAQQAYTSDRVARLVFRDLGVDISEISFEAKSKNTYENGIFSFEQIRPGPDETWILVTSAYHMPRAAGVFRKAGWQIIPYPVDHKTHRLLLKRVTLNPAGNLKRFRGGVHEWIGLAAYYLTGKTDRIFPGP